MPQNLKWSIQAGHYPGFIRAIQTFSQLFQQSEQTDPTRKYTVEGINIFIQDYPQFEWRGLMLDSSRHFLSKQAILRQIDGLMYNKMNILHWHIIDQQSFPYQIEQVPELSKYGALSGIYTSQQIDQVINYAKIRSIRVVPEIDTPAHTQSWGRSSKYKDIIVKCDDPSQGQFDPTLDLTYQVLQKVMKHTHKQFSKGFIHFGGDQTDDQCWDKRPQIKAWMKKHQISNYEELQTYYRKKQKSLFRKFSNNSIIYWANEQINLPTQQDDIIQWWGDSTTVDYLKNRSSKIILSNYDQTYLDVGFGDDEGDEYLQFITWRKVYDFNPRIKDVNIMGGQVAMWAQLNNQHTIDRKIWPRTSSFAQRLWNDKLNFTQKAASIVQRLSAQTKRMKSRGFKPAPITVQIC